MHLDLSAVSSEAIHRRRRLELFRDKSNETSLFLNESSLGGMFEQYLVERLQSEAVVRGSGAFLKENIHLEIHGKIFLKQKLFDKHV